MSEPLRGSGGSTHLNQSERLIDWAIKMNDLSQAEWLRLIRVVFPVLEQDRAARYYRGPAEAG